MNKKTDAILAIFNVNREDAASVPCEIVPAIVDCMAVVRKAIPRYWQEGR